MAFVAIQPVSTITCYDRFVDINILSTIMKNASAEMDHHNHSIGIATVHLCWIPCRRKKVLKGEIKERLYQVLSEVASEKGWVILAQTVELDHLHIFVRHQPKYSIADIANAFKGRSSRVLRLEFPELLRLPSLWTKSYCYKTAGKMSQDVIERYINDSHHHG
jgi:putative transposase